MSVTGFRRIRLAARILPVCFVGALISCSGESGNDSVAASSLAATDLPGCDVLSRRTFISLEFRDEYLWTTLTPDVDPAEPRSVEEFFRASTFKGNETLPIDRYSGFQTTESYNRFFGEGLTLGYGMAVAGQEVRGRPDSPLWIRDVWPSSPAEAAGLKRGDRVISLNGKDASILIESEDYSALNPQKLGDSIEVVFEREGEIRAVRLYAAVHPVTPLRQVRVLNLRGGAPVGLIRYHSMSTVDEPKVLEAFLRFHESKVTAAIIDLRYNGGGYVAVGQRLASHIAGPSADSVVYAELRYNEQRRSRNAAYYFSRTLDWPGVQRVYVLTGSRTCSASEQLIMGLRGAGLDVITVGSTTCGKPVGFTPSSHCGTTYSIVNFESMNALGQGRYYDGIPATCPVSEDFRAPLDDPGEPLLAAALSHAEGKGCLGATAERQMLNRRPNADRFVDGPEFTGAMLQ